jgi:hypothetical protein
MVTAVTGQGVTSVSFCNAFSRIEKDEKTHFTCHRSPGPSPQQLRAEVGGVYGFRRRMGRRGIGR